MQNVATQLQTIETEVISALTSTNLYSIQSLFSNYQNHTSINTAVNSIKASLIDLEENHDLEFNIVLDLIGSILDNFSTLDEQLENLGALFYSWLGNIELADIYE